MLMSSSSPDIKFPNYFDPLYVFTIESHCFILRGDIFGSELNFDLFYSFHPVWIKFDTEDVHNN
jgi:hypothetical protein